jgi:hypothetical protein
VVNQERNRTHALPSGLQQCDQFTSANRSLAIYLRAFCLFFLADQGIDVVHGVQLGPMRHALQPGEGDARNAYQTAFDNFE